MKAIINFSEPLEAVQIDLPTNLNGFIKDLISGFYEVPELENYYRRKFEEEAKAWEYQNLVSH